MKLRPYFTMELVQKKHEKDLKILELQALTLGHVKKMTLYKVLEGPIYKVLEVPRSSYKISS